MPNAEYDTPSSGDLNEGDAEGRRILEGLREHLRETGSLAGSFARRSGTLGGAPLRRFIANACKEFRSLHDDEGDLIRLAEKFSSGYDAITVGNLRAAPSARSGRGRRAGVMVLRAATAAGVGLFGLSEIPGSVVPHWVGILAAAVGFAAGGAMPGLGALNGEK